MIEVAALGELLIDFAEKSVDADGYPTMAAHAGGAPANFLAALNHFGHKGALLGKVGDDAFGKMLLKTLEDAGISTAGIVMDSDVFTTLAFVTFDKSGDRSFSFARKPGADKLLKEYGVSLAMVTLGPKGCYLKNRTATARVNSPKVHPVDTTGAGDIFGGSAVTQLLEAGKAPADLDEEALIKVGSFASTSASLSTEFSGGIPSIQDRETVENRIAADRKA